MNLETLLERIKSTSEKDVKLYFITRKTKPGISRQSKVKDKYLFVVYHMDCNDEVKNYIYNSTINQLQKTIEKKFEMLDYDVLMDDSEHLFTYSTRKKMFSFSDVVTNQLQKEAPKVTSIANITSEFEELWAYCVEFSSAEATNKIYTFRKILPSKVGIDEKAKKSFRTLFNTKSQQLSLLKEETVNLDEQIDCIYSEEIFYVIKKTNFETIIGLQEEIKEKAIDIAKNMISSGHLIGGEKLYDLIERKPSVRKKLLRVEKLGGYMDLSATSLKKMKRICHKYGDSLPVQDDKLVIAEENDIDCILKALGDYYKIGEISKKPYGTFLGKELQTVKMVKVS